MTTLLIDADTLAYRAALGCEKVVEDFDGNVVQKYADLDQAIATFDAEVEAICAHLGSTDVRLALTGATNFRKTIFPAYKSKRGPKPMALPALRRFLFENRDAQQRPDLEADDIVGIWATHPTLVPGPKIVVSIDKDLRSIPCTLWACDFTKQPEVITESAANYAHLTQTLTGDQTDGYPGCPGVGPKKAKVILAGQERPAALGNYSMWDAVVAAFEKRGLTAADALLQARVARILRHTDFNFKTKEPILWTPPQQS